MLVGLAFGASPARADSDVLLRIVAFGDSTTATRDAVGHVYAQRLPVSLAERGITAEVTNAGVPGNTTTDARRRFQNDVLDRRPDLIIIQFGRNDDAVGVHATVCVAGAAGRALIGQHLEPTPQLWNRFVTCLLTG